MSIAGVEIAALTLDEAVDGVLALVGRGTPSLVVTPNVDHIVRFGRDAEFATVYESAALRLADGAPIVMLSRLLRTPLPERVTGVDLTVALLDACARYRRSVYFLGGDAAVLEHAVERVRADHPRLTIAGFASPMVDLEAPTSEEQDELQACRQAAPDLLFVFLGSPKQEKWFAQHASRLPPAVVLAVGGTVDFLAGAKRRAPRWVQSIGFEWLWRLSLEPGRLFHRYVVQDSRFVLIATGELARRYLRIGERSPRVGGAG